MPPSAPRLAASQPETPLPWRQVLLLAFVAITEPIHLSVVFPFIYFMVRDFDLSGDSRSTGFYVGLLAAAFSVAQLSTNLAWGLTSDRIGRRPVLLIGVFGSIVCSVLFGMSPSLTWAILSRVCWGALNGNSSTIKTILGELTDETNQARGFSILPLCWNVGSVVGPIIGGLLVDPVHNLPGLFGGSTLFLTYPYLLPCLFCSLLSVVAWSLNLLFLQETLVRQDLSAADADVSRLRTSLSTDTLHPACDETAPLTSPTVHPALYDSNVSITSGTDGESEDAFVTALPPAEAASHQALSLSSVLRGDPTRCAVGGLGVALLTVMFDQMFPVWAATDFMLGGLSMPSQSIGFALSAAGVSVIYLQLHLYPKAQRIWGSLRCFQYGVALAAVIIPLFPILHLLEDSGKIEYSLASSSLRPLTWAVMFVLLAVKEWSCVLYFTSIHILTNNSVPDRRYLGTVNSVAHSAASLARTVGPVLAGSLWTWSLGHDRRFPLDFSLVFSVVGILSLVTYLLTLKWDPRMNHRAFAKPLQL